MIRATTLSGRQIAINAELIKSAEATPDTIVTMTTGSTMIVRESLEEIIRRIIEYQREIRKSPLTAATPAHPETSES